MNTQSVTVHWNGYTFTITYDGQRFVAIESKGRDKKRMNRNVWFNIHDCSRVNPDLAEQLEQGVSEWQRVNSTTPKPSRNGHQPRKLNSGRPARRTRARESKAVRE